MAKVWDLGVKGLGILYKCVNPNVCKNVEGCRPFISSADPGQVPEGSKWLGLSLFAQQSTWHIVSDQYIFID